MFRKKAGVGGGEKLEGETAETGEAIENFYQGSSCNKG